MFVCASVAIEKLRMTWYNTSIMKHGRQEEMIELLRRGDVLGSEETARRFGVTSATIRRDFAKLTAAGEACRFHGGIRAVEERRDPALPFAMRREWHSEVKMRLAEEAVRQLPRQGVLFVDGGTTTACLGHFLKDSELRIVTNSIAFFDCCRQLGEHAPLQLLTGGVYNHKSGILLGPEAERSISHFHADVAVISGSALDESSLYDNREDAAQLQRCMIENSDRLIVVADSSKLGSRAMCRSVDSGRISLLVTNFDPEKHALIAELRRRGVSVLVIPRST